MASKAAKLTELAMLYRQLAALTGAGITAGQSASVISGYQQGSRIANQSGSPAMRRALETIKQRLWQGQKMSQAMAEWPQIFPKFHLALLAEGEATGQLDIALSRLAELTERDLALFQEMRGQTFYPTVAITFAVPVLIVAFASGDEMFVPWIAGAILIACFVLIRAASSLIACIQGQGNSAGLKLAMATPGIGPLAQKIAIAYFARTLGLLASAGVPIVHAVDYAADASGNPWLAGPVRRIIPKMAAGRPLRESLASTGIFPPYFLSMLATAEETGSMDSQMRRTAAFYETEVAHGLRTFCMVMGVVVVLIVGVLSGIITIIYWKNHYENIINNPFGAHTSI